MYAGTAMTLRGQHGLADCAMGPLLRCELAGRWPDQHVSHIQSQTATLAMLALCVLPLVAT